MNNIKVALFINSKLGLQILKFLLSHPDVKIQFIVINEDRKRGNDYLEYLNECMLESKIRIPVIKNNDLKQEKLPPFDFGVSAMFGHIINDSLIEMAAIDFINLHPSLLPIGRGANPISWSIIENKPQGATIHKLTSKLDSGEIYQQSEVKFGIDANASIVYKKLNDLLFKMFVSFFNDWIDGKIQPLKPITTETSFHLASELDSIRTIHPEDVMNAEQFIRKIQALNFENGSSAIFLDAIGIEWNLRISLETKEIVPEVKN